MVFLSEEHLQSVSHLIRKCGQTARQMALEDFQVYEKGWQDYVTDVDRILDQQLTQGLVNWFPEDAVISEENSISWNAFGADPARLWLVDPLDGTDDFIQGSSYYAVMAGLLVKHQPLLGWVYAPAFDRLCYGGIDFGLFQQEGDAPPTPLQPIEPKPPTAEFCPILLGHKDRRRFGDAILRQIPAAQFSTVGSFGLKVLQVITGQAGLYIYLNQRVKLWDTTAPLALAKAAGLVCCDLNAEPLRFTPDAVDANTLAHQQPIIVGWQSYIEPLLPRIQAAIAECQTQAC